MAIVLSETTYNLQTNLGRGKCILSRATYRQIDSAAFSKTASFWRSFDTQSRFSSFGRENPSFAFVPLASRRASTLRSRSPRKRSLHWTSCSSSTLDADANRFNRPARVGSGERCKRGREGRPLARLILTAYGQHNRIESGGIKFVLRFRMQG